MYLFPLSWTHQRFSHSIYWSGQYIRGLTAETSHLVVFQFTGKTEHQSVILFVMEVYKLTMIQRMLIACSHP